MAFGIHYDHSATPPRYDINDRGEWSVAEQFKPTVVGAATSPELYVTKKPTQAMMLAALKGFCKDNSPGLTSYQVETLMAAYPNQIGLCRSPFAENEKDGEQRLSARYHIVVLPKQPTPASEALYQYDPSGSEVHENYATYNNGSKFQEFLNGFHEQYRTIRAMPPLKGEDVLSQELRQEQDRQRQAQNAKNPLLRHRALNATPTTWKTPVKTRDLSFLVLDENAAYDVAQGKFQYHVAPEKWSLPTDLRQDNNLRTLGGTSSLLRTG